MSSKNIIKKYKLTSKTKKYNGKTLYRIQAEKDFFDVKKGDLGGFVESEENLSHQGDCWVYNQAIVKDNASVRGNAMLLHKSVAQDFALIDGYSRILGNSIIKDKAQVLGETIVNDQCIIYGNAKLHCSQDGPQITEGSIINFHVSYHQQYTQLRLNYADKIINISEKGLICFDDWSGTLEQFQKLVKSKYSDWEEMTTAVEIAQIYINNMKNSYRFGDGKS